MSSNIFSKIVNCRICGHNEIKLVISLGQQLISSRFPKYLDFSTPKVDINLCECKNKNCRLLQLYETVNQSELYEYEYGYRSGLNNSMRQHLKSYKEEIEELVELNEGDYVLDIGSNDSTLLSYYSDKYNRIGIDPTGKQFQEYYQNITLVPSYFTKEIFLNNYGNNKCKIISSISMFYDIPKPVEFAKDIHECLHEDGIWTCEQSYLITMIKRNSIDTICHEHLEYYSLKQIKYIADLAGFKIINVLFNDCNGGSFRIYMAKKTSKKYKENIELVSKILQEEFDFGIEKDNFYENFINSCNSEINKLKKFINLINKDNKKIFVYGASTKGNTLLQYAGLGEESIPFAVERNMHKINKMTSTGIKIIGEDEMRNLKPDYLLVLPYHFKEEIIKREEEYLNNGGQLIFPFPNFEIYSSKPKLLITGSDGFIGSYVKEIMNDYILYGINRHTKKFEKKIHKFEIDMNDKCSLENIINIVKPNTIVHLAGNSSAEYCFKNTIEAIFNNGILTAYLCDIIHKNNLNIKLFNASSSEIFKGHNTFIATDNEKFKYHNHPYSISKIMGQSIIDFYRETYNLPFSNGIIFTTESYRKSENFLLNKIVKHIKQFTNTKEILILGSLQSYRNIIHPIDVANAISYIIKQEKGNNYLICNTDENICIYDLVVKLYSKASINLIKNDNILYDKDTNEPVIKIKNIQHIENNIIDIKGYPENLLNLGWKPMHNIDFILNELLDYTE
jgi:GDP-D-mannose dehydratase